MSNQRFSEEFKIEAVRQVTERGLPVAEVTPRLGMSAHSLYAWIKRYSKPATLVSEAGRSLRKPGLFKQPGSHAYKQATVEQPDIPNWLSHEFTTERSNQVCCGDITYIWGQGRWIYLAAVLDLHTRRVIGWPLSDKPDAELVIKSPDRAGEQ